MHSPSSDFKDKKSTQRVFLLTSASLILFSSLEIDNVVYSQKYFTCVYTQTKQLQQAPPVHKYYAHCSVPCFFNLCLAVHCISVHKQFSLLRTVWFYFEQMNHILFDQSPCCVLLLQTSLQPKSLYMYNFSEKQMFLDIKVPKWDYWARQFVYF